jgi:hypothetical protein
MNFLLLTLFLGCLLELFLYVKFRILEKKLKRLKRTGKVTEIEITAKWKLFISLLLFSIPLLGVYIFL